VAEVVGSHGGLSIPVGMGHDGGAGAGAGSGVGAMEVAAAAGTSTWPILVQDRRWDRGQGQCVVLSPDETRTEASEASPPVYAIASGTEQDLVG
jgi:hypothetical protein